MIAPEVKEFKDWLKRHGNRLRGYAPDEVARLAMACGFPTSIVCGGVCDHVSNLKRLFAFWENPLAENWMRLTSYQNGRDA